MPPSLTLRASVQNWFSKNNQLNTEDIPLKIQSKVKQQKTIGEIVSPVHAEFSDFILSLLVWAKLGY